MDCPRTSSSQTRPDGAGLDAAETSRLHRSARARAVLAPLALLLSWACSKPSSPSAEGTGTDTDPSDTDPSAADTSTTAPAEPDEWDELVDPVPGSRLRPVFRTAEDGTRAHIRWHDTVFDAPCDFRTTVDGVLRCIPIEQSGEPWLYADPSCTQPVLQAHEIPEGAVVVKVDGSGCFDETYYEVGEAVTEIYYDENGPCQFFSNDPAHRVYAYPVEQLVSATVTPADGNSRVVPLVLAADDGARQIVGAWDHVHQEQVVPDLDATDQLRWLGRWPARVSPFYYGDPACTERVALSTCVPGSEQPRTAFETDGSCGPVVGRYELLDEVGTVYTLGGGGCEQDGLPSTSRAWRVGAALGDDAFAVAPAVGELGPRLRHDVYCNPEGEPFLSSLRFFDLVLAEAECVWRDFPPLGTGTHDCIPRDAPTPGHTYDDPACTERVAYRSVAEGTCYQEPLYAYAAGLAAAVLGQVSGPGDYELGADDACVPVEPDGGSDSGDGGEQDYFIVDQTEIEVAHAMDVVE